MAETNGVTKEKASASSEYQAKLARLKAGRQAAEQAAEEARRKRDADELEKVFEALDACDGTWEGNVLHIADAPPDLPGHLVLCRPMASAVRQFKATILSGVKLDADRGSTERRVKANHVYVLNCLKYPSIDQYEKLCEFAAGIPETAVKIVHRLADAGAHDDAKE